MTHELSLVPLSIKLTVGAISMESLVTRSLFGVMNADVPRVPGELSLYVISFAYQGYASKRHAVWDHEMR